MQMATDPVLGEVGPGMVGSGAINVRFYHRGRGEPAENAREFITVMQCAYILQYAHSRRE